MDEHEIQHEPVRGLAPSATPSVVYGFLGLGLIAVPLAGFIVGWMAIFRSHQAAIQMDRDDRLEGRGLRRAGMVLGIIVMIGNTAAIALWIWILTS